MGGAEVHVGPAGRQYVMKGTDQRLAECLLVAAFIVATNNVVTQMADNPTLFPSATPALPVVTKHIGTLVATEASAKKTGPYEAASVSPVFGSATAAASMTLPVA